MVCPSVNNNNNNIKILKAAQIILSAMFSREISGENLKLK